MLTSIEDHGDLEDVDVKTNGEICNSEEVHGVGDGSHVFHSVSFGNDRAFRVFRAFRCVDIGNSVLEHVL